MPPPTEGERWAEDQLRSLLAARFAPRACARFLLASQRRTNLVRRERPAVARQAWLWIAVGAFVWVGLASAGAQPFARRRRLGLGWWAATGLMLDWHIGMVETEDGQPRPLGPADAATLVRVWLAPVAADGPTPAVCAVALASDGLDGALARRGEPTRIGRDLEGLADACFAVAALRGALRRGWLGGPAAALELARLGIGLGYTLSVYFASARAPDATVVRAARLTTPVRAAGLLAAGLGRRRWADGLVSGGAVWSALAVVRAVRRTRARSR